MRHYITLLIELFCALTLNAQITVLERRTLNDESKTNTNIYKYDSLSNIEFYNKMYGPDFDYTQLYTEGEYKPENLAHLIGQRFYFYADSSEISRVSDLKFYRINSTKRKKKNPEIYYSSAMFINKYFTFVGYERNRYSHNTFKLIPENESDTLYCSMGHFIRDEYWTVEGYFVKAKNDYLHKKYVLIEHFKEYDDMNWLYSLDTDSCAKDLPYHSVWECTDVTLKGYKARSVTPRVILVFTNNKLGQYYIYLDKFYFSLVGMKQRRNRKTLDLFMPLEEYEKEMAVKKTEVENRLNKLKKLYGEVKGTRIFIGQIELGDTPAMCIDAWGNPIDIHTTTGSYGTHEQWVYDNNRYLYFENDKLTDIQY